jgi:hypothetical protein
MVDIFQKPNALKDSGTQIIGTATSFRTEGSMSNKVETINVTEGWMGS